MNVAIWGTGLLADELSDEIEKNDGIEKDNILFFCDNDSVKQGTTFHGLRVVAPVELKNTQVDYLIIANGYCADIRKQIKKESLISDDRIVESGFYRQLLYARTQYFKRYGKKHGNNAADDSGQSTVIYTAIMGEYDDLADPLIVDENIKYICVTNNRDVKSDVWDVRYIENENLSNVMLARRIKLLPWEYFHCEGLNIWVDANLPIKADLREYAGNYMQGRGILCFPHSERCCICDEAAAVVSHRPDIKRDVIIQTAEYMKAGMPLNFGLYETGCMVRDFGIPMVKKLMQDWWDELVRYTYRDQISLPYVCWKNNFLPDICDQSVWWNEWLAFNKHKNDKC